MATNNKGIIQEIINMLDTYDTNRDGEITKIEAVEYFKSKKAFNPERSAMYLFKAYDKDGDGKITIKELSGDADIQKALQDYLDKIEKEQKQEREIELDVEAFFLKYDENKDEEISKDELIKKLKETGSSNPEKSVDFILGEMDKNNDGKITTKELRKYYQKVQKLLNPQQ
ncbi:hypothetical protein ACTA71_005840 [Dictyostelium dimigraforme]